MLPRVRTEAIVVGILHADIQPLSSPAKIVSASLAAMRIFAKKKADRLLVLVDHEGRGDCAGEWCGRMEGLFNKLCKKEGLAKVRVIVKVQTFENWMVSDPEAIALLRSRFDSSKFRRASVAPNKADHVDAVRMLKRSAHRSEYEKSRDAVAVMSRLDPYAAAADSRSFRRFMRLVGCPTYANQSKAPVP
jgi:hypothetical protein